MKFDNLKGYMLAGLAAAAYGTNPAFAIPLYDQGMNPNSVLLFRYLLGLPILAAIMAWRGVPFKLEKAHVLPTAIPGILMAISSLTLFESYKHMNSGIASTLLFVYPIMVALMMILFYKERFKASVAICLAIMAAGLIMLMKPAGGDSVSVSGCLLVMVSALTYAVYIVFVNVSPKAKKIPTTKLLFHVLGWGSIVYAAMTACGTPLTTPSEPSGWLNLMALAIIPTVLSLACTTRAIQLIGSTPTAILGALEPVSAVILSVVALGQTMTFDEVTGGVLIVIATIIVIADKPVDRFILHARKMFPRHKHR